MKSLLLAFVLALPGLVLAQDETDLGFAKWPNPVTPDRVRVVQEDLDGDGYLEKYLEAEFVTSECFASYMRSGGFVALETAQNNFTLMQVELDGDCGIEYNPPKRAYRLKIAEIIEMQPVAVVINDKWFDLR